MFPEVIRFRARATCSRSLSGFAAMVASSKIGSVVADFGDVLVASGVLPAEFLLGASFGEFLLCCDVTKTTASPRPATSAANFHCRNGVRRISHEVPAATGATARKIDCAMTPGMAV